MYPPTTQGHSPTHYHSAPPVSTLNNIYLLASFASDPSPSLPPLATEQLISKLLAAFSHFSPLPDTSLSLQSTPVPEDPAYLLFPSVLRALQAGHPVTYASMKPDSHLCPLPR